MNKRTKKRLARLRMERALLQKESWSPTDLTADIARETNLTKDEVSDVLHERVMRLGEQIERLQNPMEAYKE